MQGGGVTLGKSHTDLLKENRATSYQGYAIHYPQFLNLYTSLLLIIKTINSCGQHNKFVFILLEQEENELSV